MKLINIISISLLQVVLLTACGTNSNTGDDVITKNGKTLPATNKLIRKPIKESMVISNDSYSKARGR